MATYTRCLKQPAPRLSPAVQTESTARPASVYFTTIATPSIGISQVCLPGQLTREALVDLPVHL